MATTLTSKAEHVAFENMLRWHPDLRNRSRRAQAVHLALELAGESGEAVEVIKKWNRLPSDMGSVPDGLRDELGDELADALENILAIAGCLGIDLDAMLDRKRHRNNHRFPKEGR